MMCLIQKIRFNARISMIISSVNTRSLRHSTRYFSFFVPFCAVDRNILILFPCGYDLLAPFTRPDTSVRDCHMINQFVNISFVCTFYSLSIIYSFGFFLSFQSLLCSFLPIFFSFVAKRLKSVRMCCYLWKSGA